MPAERLPPFFRAAIVAWCEISALAVVLTGDVSEWLAALVLVLIPVFGFAGENARWLPAARRLASVLTVAYFVFFPLDWLVFSDWLIFAVSHLLFFLKLHTLLHLYGPRERGRLYCLCLLEVLSAASMTVEVQLVVSLVAFVFAGALALILEQAARSVENEPEVLPRAVRTAAALGTLMMVVAGAFFAMIPRSSYAGFRLSGLDSVITTGVGEEVALGDFGRIKKSREAVMRIWAGDDDWRSAPRWRGAVYDRYLGGHWRQTLTGRRVISPYAPRQFALGSNPGGRAVVSEVYLEPMDTSVVFLPPGSFHLMVAVPYLYRDGYGTPRAGRPATAGRRYFASWTAAGDSSPLAGFPSWTEEHRPLYLQLPPLSERFYRLAAGVAPGKPESELGAAVVDHLMRNYRYILDTPKRVQVDPLEDFLFGARAGHCEYFASAMIAILRARGVPARLVTGFLRGEMNHVGGFEVVRKSDAHAWVEVFDPGRGWVTYDPTPPASDESLTRFFLWSQAIESLRMLWESYVVAFDSDRQRALQGMLSRVLSRSMAFLRDLPVGILLMIAGLVVLVMGTRPRWGKPRSRILRLRWHKWRKGLAAGRPESAVRFYGDLLSRLERWGFPKPAGATPAEYARRHEQRLPGLSELTEAYYGVRFGRKRLGPDEQRRVETLAVAVQMAAWSTAETGRREPRT
jgi:transglutaminase-like putative cysteine protease